MPPWYMYVINMDARFLMFIEDEDKDDHTDMANIYCMTGVDDTDAAKAIK